MASANSFMPSIQISDLNHRFGSLQLFDDLQLQVAAGEYLVLLGESGSGKTSLLEFIAGLFLADRGNLSLHGQPIHGTAPHRRGIAFSFQLDALYPHLRVRQNITFGSSQPSDSQTTLQNVAVQTRITELLDRYPGQLSGGEKKRVGLAKALYRGAKILLLDEPLSAIDASHRKELVDDLRQFHHRCDATVIHVTHDAEEAFRLADRVAILHQGQIQQLDSPAKILADPNHLSAARMMLGYHANEFFVQDGTMGSNTLTLGIRVNESTDQSHQAEVRTPRIVIPSSAIRVHSPNQTNAEIDSDTWNPGSTPQRTETSQLDDTRETPGRAATFRRVDNCWYAQAEKVGQFASPLGSELELRIGPISCTSTDQHIENVQSANGVGNQRSGTLVEITVDADRVFWFAPDGSRMRHA